MKKQEINGADFTNWMHRDYAEYASQTWNGKRLCLMVNHHGIYIVIHGGEIMYEGSSRTMAIMAWNEAQ